MIKERAHSAALAIKALPESVRIGVFDLAIIAMPSHQAEALRRFGEFSVLEQVIRVQENMPTAQKAVDTVLHEIAHGIFWAYGIDDEDKEERIVGTTASAWAQVWRDNPDLLAWVQKWVNA